MTMSNFKTYLNSFLLFTERKTPEILTGFGIVGLIKTAHDFYKAGIKAGDILYDYEKDMALVSPGDKETIRVIKQEKLKRLTPVLAPPIVMATVTGACILGSNSVSRRRITALSAAYSVTEAALKEYKHKTKELVGESKAQNIREAISKDRVQKNPVPENVSQIMIPGDGNVLCMDSYSGRYFPSNKNKIDRAVNELSSHCAVEMYVELNEFYSLLGLPMVPIGNDLGWNADDLIQGTLPITTTAVLTEDGRPCLCVEYDIRLRHDFRNLH